MSVVEIRRRQIRCATAAFAALALLNCAVAGPSVAGPADPPAPAIAPTWTGFYVGGNIGLRSTQTNWTGVDFFGPSIPGLNEQSFSDAKFRYGAYGGFNWQFLPRWVVGVEGDWGSAKKTTTQAGFLPGFSGIFFPLIPGDTASVRTTWDASARGRLGFLLTPSLMVYGTGGPSRQHFELTSTCGPLDCVPVATARTEATRRAWTIGGGIEAQFAHNWLARAEYRYADYGTAHEVLNFPSPISHPAFADIALKTNTFTFGLAYRLDPAGASDAYAAADSGAWWPAIGSTGHEWNGPYVGADGGVRSSQFLWNTVAINGFPVAIPLFPDTTHESFNDTMFRKGLYGGYNWQFAPQWIAGLEGDWGTANKTTTQYGFLPGFAGVFGPIDLGDSISVKTRWDASARARLGLLVTPSLLVYGTAGKAWQRYDVTAVCGTISCGSTKSITKSITAPGWTYGGGIEAAIIGGWRARAEYRYANYGTSRELLNNYPFPFPLSLFPMSVATDFKLSTQTVLFGLGYIFN